MKFKRIKTKRLVDCDSSLYTQFRDLNMRENGLMRGRLSSNRRHKNDDTYVNYILDKDNRVIAWSLIFSNAYSPVAYFYTRKKYRNMGLGTKLIKTAAKTCNNKLKKKMDFCAWGGANGFFKKCSQRGIINKKNSVRWDR